MRILIAGTGAMAVEFERYLEDGVEVIGYIETLPENKCKNGKPIFRYDEIERITYDKIVVANIYSEEIKETIKEYELENDKIIFLHPWTDLRYEEGCILFHWDVLEEIAPRYIDEKLNCNKRYFIGNRMLLDDIEDTILNEHKVQQRDYFRYRTFELVANQIKDLCGAVAEVGVFQGEFAQLINKKFPNKKLYLFDTFESFNKEEFNKEKNEGNCEEDFYDIFQNTNEQRVLKRMPYPDKCIIRKGLFPISAQGIEEEFIFVSIDVDFEKSIYDCMCWFYPRMVEGGIIFVHDYNNKKLFGVKKAIEQYEKEIGRLSKVPLGDWGGTVVIVKQ